MTRADLLWIAAYGPAFAQAMALHGQTRRDVRDDGGGCLSIVEVTIDARDEADAWARVVAAAAVERGGAR